MIQVLWTENTGDDFSNSLKFDFIIKLTHFWLICFNLFMEVPYQQEVVELRFYEKWQTLTLQKSLSYENLGTPQDIRNIRVQFSVLKSHVMCELSSLNQKISSLSENLEKAVNDMKVQDRNVDLLHENVKILQNELSPKNEQCLISTVFNSLSTRRNDQTISDQQQQQ